MASLLQAIHDTVLYYIAFAYFYIAKGKPIDSCPCFQGNPVALVHLFTLAKTLHLWDMQHYRAASFAEDLRANLRNVAIPGTGVPLSVFCINRATALFFILVVNPLACLVAACYLALHGSSSSWGLAGSQQQRRRSVAAMYGELLLQPQHWFAIWRHNCLLMGYHALVTRSSSYSLEDKGTFLLQGDRLGLPVSPFYSDAAVFVKHKSIEGGMGIHVYKNFVCGGDWIIQAALRNSPFLCSMLPSDGAPLSTLRVVTASIAWLDAQGCVHQLGHLNQQHQLEGGSSSRSPGKAVASSPQQQQHNTPSSSSGSKPHETVPGGKGVRYRCQRPPTPPLPVSAGVVRRLTVEGRAAGQFVDAASALREQGPADPAQQQQQQQGQGQLPDNHRGSAAAAAARQSGMETHQPVLQPPACEHEHEDEESAYAGRVEVVTAVWRAGLAGCHTDHASVCFNIDPDTGELGRGVTANHWYRLGLAGVGRVDAAARRVWGTHPDSGRNVTGRVLPGMSDVLAAVRQAHMVAAPDLPLVGWDVALTPDGVYILEVNLSCNLFNGCFDSEGYYNMMIHYYAHLSELEQQQAAAGKGGLVQQLPRQSSTGQ